MQKKLQKNAKNAKKMLKYLRMSRKSSTFAPAFRKFEFWETKNLKSQISNFK